MLYGLAAYVLGNEIDRYARPVAMTFAVVGAIAIMVVLAYWRRKEQELAAEAERAIPGLLQATD